MFWHALGSWQHCRGSYSHYLKRQVSRVPKLQQLKPLESRVFPKPRGELRKSPHRGNCGLNLQGLWQILQNSPNEGLFFLIAINQPGGWDRWRLGLWWWLVKCWKYQCCVFLGGLSYPFSGSWVFFLFFLCPCLLVIFTFKALPSPFWASLSNLLKRNFVQIRRNSVCLSVCFPRLFSRLQR